VTTTLIPFRRSGRNLRWLEWKALIALYGEWRRRLRSRRELATMSERSLRDVGLTRYDAAVESQKPFWRA
jgi:uncharacterized protein YjiS (DUF1127 family)